MKMMILVALLQSVVFLLIGEAITLVDRGMNPGTEIVYADIEKPPTLRPPGSLVYNLPVATVVAKRRDIPIEDAEIKRLPMQKRLPPPPFIVSLRESNPRPILSNSKEPDKALELINVNDRRITGLNHLRTRIIDPGDVQSENDGLFFIRPPIQLLAFNNKARG